jgi:hypothetical protein
MLRAVCVACTFAPAMVFAQEPWTVTLTPTLNPLPIGLCGAVQLSVIDPATNDAPRNSQQQRVTIADFDLTVSGASAAGRQIDASHFEACACQGGVAGTAATVVASYPAQALLESARVPKVEPFQATARFTLAPAKGTVDPPACVAAAATPSARISSVELAPLERGAPRTAAPATGSPIPGTPVDRGVARSAAYSPMDVTIAPSLGAIGVWSEPGLVTLTPVLDAEGSWSEAGLVTVRFALSATGNWVGAPASTFTAP